MPSAIGSTSSRPGAAAQIALGLALGIGALLPGRVAPAQTSNDLPSGAVVLTPAERAWLDAHPSIRLSGYAGYEPVEYLKDGEHHGMVADYVALVERQLGIEFTLVPVEEWQAILDAAKPPAPAIDVIPLAAETADRIVYLRFTSPYLEWPASIIGRAESGELSMADLDGKVVSLVEGYAVQEFLEIEHPGITLEFVPSNVAGLRSVSNGTSYAFISDLTVASYHMKRQGLTDLRIMEDTGYVYRMGFAVRADEEWRPFVGMLQKALDSIPIDTRNAIYQKWIPFQRVDLSDSAESAADRTPLMATVLIGVGSVLLIAAGFLLWNRALTRKVEARTAAYRRELSERKRAQRLQSSRNRVLEQLAGGRSLEQVLGTLVLGVEEAKPGMKGSVLLLDDDRKRLRCAAAPHLPDSYNKAINGLAIGPKVGSCGAAAYSGRRVIASDVMAHPNWERYRDMAKKANIGACWSEPIVSSSSQILGTLAMYYAEPREPTADDLELMKNTANLAGIAIQRAKTEVALRASDAKLADYAAELEDRVAKRTRDLEAARDELLALNERFRTAKDTAEVASLSKSEFLANMSHEIRSPMTAILGYAEIVYDEEKRSGAPASRIEAIDTIRRNGKQLLSIINDILDLSKFEAGKMTVERAKCSPVRIVTDVIDLMRVRADAKGLTLDTVYDGTIPETILSDATRLRQILVNLIGNAIKFTERGGIRLTLRLYRAEDDPEQLLAFEVLDSGIGIDDEHMEELFQPFAQADASTTRKFGGTGLGLTISRRFAMLLGGDITVQGERGVGCTFTVCVGTGPLDGVRLIEPGSSLGYGVDETAEDLSAEEGSEESGSTDEFTLDGIRVLLAEDTLDNQRLIMHHLRRWGAHLEIADDGRAAMESVLQAERNGDPFDLVLMDMQMPEMDGYEATRRLRDSGFTRPIIALTAHAMRGDRERCLAAGMDDYVSKPIEPSTLFTAIIQAVGRAMMDAFSDNGAPAAAEAESPSPPPTSAEILDGASALERAGGSSELLTELIDIFLKESGRRLAELHKAAGKGDSDCVSRTAHALKGSVSNFSAAAATEAALRVEQLAKEGMSDDLETALSALDREIARLRPELLALRDG